MGTNPIAPFKFAELVQFATHEPLAARARLLFQGQEQRTHEPVDGLATV
jgi:hypothetical protein